MQKNHPQDSNHNTLSAGREATDRDLPRRQVLRLGWIGALVLLIGGQLWFLVRLFLSGNAPRGVRTAVVVGPVEQFPPGSATQFWKEGFVLVHSRTGFLALSQQCTHNRCNVHYLPEEKILHCPCHGAQFSLTGTVLTGPAPRSLPHYVTRIEAGQLIVDTTSLKQST